ncbi:hypothetical protein BDB01DRAFT_834087 [Pilobolus umbonatus]|nr:hypothetical protein BDB01DRAFT_834087 [Pilobolus umbonatus]
MTSNRVFRKQSTTKKQKKPFQMGLEVKVPSLRLTGKKQYAMENLQSFKFPRTSAQLKSGELGILINGLTLIEELNLKGKKEAILKDWLSDDEESVGDGDEESESDSDNQGINDETTNNDLDEE